MSKRTKNIIRNPREKMRLRARLIRSKTYKEFNDNYMRLISRVMGIPINKLTEDIPPSTSASTSWMNGTIVIPKA